MNSRFLPALLILATASPLAAQQPSSADRPKITVTGESLVYARPDKIVINFGIETRDTHLVPAKQKNAAIWKKAAALLKEQGIPNKDVQTDYLSIEPRHRNRDEIDEPIGYVARNMFAVTISDPAKVEGLISDMLTAGVNQVTDVEFQTTEFKRHRESARELALKAAREKADKMAATLGCSVGEPLTIDESDRDYYGRSAANSNNSIKDTRDPDGGEPQGMALGKISIRASVSVTFALKHGRSQAPKP